MSLKMVQRLRRLYEAGEKDLTEARKKDRYAENPCEVELREAFKSKAIRPSDFSIQQLFESLVPNGHELLTEWKYESRAGGHVALRESIGGVSLKGFSYVTGQMIYTTVMEEWEKPQYIADKLVTNVPSPYQQELIPVVSNLGDVGQELDDLDEYPMATLTDGGVRTPVTKRRGVQIAVSKDTVLFDRTGDVLRKAGNLTEVLRIGKEKRVLRSVCGIVNDYTFNEAKYDTYLSSGNWVNLQTGNALADYTDIQAAENLLMQMTDPFSGEPIMVTPKALVIPHTLHHQARQILNATEVRTGSSPQHLAPNTLNPYEIIMNQYVKSITSSATTWFFGDPKRAFAYMENYPITVEDRPLGDESFSRGIVAGWAVYERGTVAVLEPRAMVKCTA